MSTASITDAVAQLRSGEDQHQESADQVPAPEPKPKPASAETKAWVAGVSAEKQRKARQLFAEGNELLDNLGFAKAAAKYRQALEHWAHPAIQYNLALALINLDQPIDAYLAITQALRFGEAPLEPEQHKQALNYQRLLRNQIGEIEVTSNQEGVDVKLDGKRILTGPGTTRTLVLPGEHQLVAGKRGYQTVTRTLSIYPDKVVRVTLQLFTEKQLTATRRRWKPWQPWAVIGAGLGIGLAGGGLHYWGARSNVKSFDAELARVCPMGCHDDDRASPSSRLHRGVLQQKIAWSTYVAGGVIVAAGIAGLIANFPRKVRLDRSAEETRISVGSSLSSERVILEITGTF